MKKKVFSVKSGRKLLTRAAVAGASLLLATVLLPIKSPVIEPIVPLLL